MKTIDISDHISLINNHGYNGFIAIYNGPKALTSSPGDIVLVKNVDGYCVIEKPYSEDMISKNKAKGILIKTYCTCVGVPVRFLTKIKLTRE